MMVPIVRDERSDTEHELQSMIQGKTDFELIWGPQTMGKQLQYLCNCDEDQFDDYFKMMDGLLKSQRSDDAILFYYRLANMEEFNNFIFAVIFFS